MTFPAIRSVRNLIKGIKAMISKASETPYHVLMADLVAATEQLRAAQGRQERAGAGFSQADLASLHADTLARRAEVVRLRELVSVHPYNQDQRAAAGGCWNMRDLRR